MNATDRMSPEARVLVTERRRWARFWRRAWPWLAIALVTAWAAFDAWWFRHQSQLQRVEAEQRLILSQERCHVWGDLPGTVFVLQGNSVQQITDTLQRIETSALMLRMSERQGNVDTRVFR